MSKTEKPPEPTSTIPSTVPSTTPTRGPNKFRMKESADGKTPAGGTLEIDQEISISSDQMGTLFGAGFDSVSGIREFFSDQMSDTPEVLQKKVSQILDPGNLLAIAKRYKKNALMVEQEQNVARNTEIEAELAKM